MNTFTNRLLWSVPLAAALTGFSQSTPPVFTKQPTNQYPYIDGRVTFTAAATGNPPPTYQWRFNGHDLPDKTNSYLIFATLSFTNAGPYTVVANNEAGTVTSDTVWLSVLPTNVVHLADRELQFGNMSAPIWLGPKIDDYGPLISGDGLTLIYESGDYDVADLFVVTRSSVNSTNWSAPMNLGTNVNSAFHDGGATISPDGLSLYFDSTRPGGYGNHDIYVCTRPDKSSPFGPAVNLGPAVNGPKDEGGPVGISADNLTLVFGSNRPGTLGNVDAWMCTRSNASLPWQPPVHLPAPINAANSDTFPIGLSGDGLTMFLKSDRPNVSNPAGAYVTRRHSRSEPFGAPVLIRPVLATGNAGVDLGGLSSDGKTLWIDTFEKVFQQWTRVVQFSIEELPELEIAGSDSAGRPQFNLHGRAGATYEVQSSPDLKSWATFLTTSAADVATFPDPAPVGNAQRFYRVLSH
jgi:hypothetical protein